MNDSSLLGECRIIPKKLILKPNEFNNGHAHFSDPVRAFKTLKEQNSITPEFRIIGDFPVDTHIISALWINMIGHKFDACLDESSYGSRLRRVRNEKVLDKNAPKSFHITAIGSFEPYFQPYQKWRKNGLQAIRWELEKEHKVIAVSLDLKNYYHSIDPTFFASSDFQTAIGLNNESHNLELINDFTNQLSELLKHWSSNAGEFIKVFLGESDINHINGGLAIGLTASRIISNVLLHSWDKLVLEKITPIYYGRYIDDMFLVLRDPGTINNTHELMEYFQERIGEKRLIYDDEIWRILSGYPNIYTKDLSWESTLERTACQICWTVINTLITIMKI
ncbi:RNA-directed DNA polymerase [uncultured Legionella sp.]|uniref:RNA-directed DNA polymerase n=1 Tax=uncultured Legionella sp. TaxID=210934 RepID=UPI002617EB4B|nr:RNA-directed DNA polymerase [uncultured Legionella sp.]